MAKQHRKNNRTAGSTPNRINKKANVNTSQELRQADLTELLRPRDLTQVPGPPPVAGTPNRLTGNAPPEVPVPTEPTAPTAAIPDGWDDTDEDIEESSGSTTTSPSETSGREPSTAVTPPAVRFQAVTGSARQAVTGSARPSGRNPYARAPMAAGRGRGGRLIAPPQPRPSALRNPQNPTILRTRIDIRFTFTANQADVTGFRVIFGSLLEALQAVDPTTKILPWFEDQLAPPIHDHEDFPENLQRMRKYADRFYIPELARGEKSREFWTAVYISHTKDIQFIRANLKWRHDVFNRPLQCPQTSTVGFGLYSTRYMDTDRLSQRVSELCGFQVLCKWRVILVENYRQLKPSERTRAIHFEVDSVNEARAKKRLPKLYPINAQDSSEFPAGYRLRFVYTLANLQQHHRPNFSALITRQRALLEMVANKEMHYSGSSIDYKHPTLPFTIRQVLETSYPEGDPSNLTFLGIKLEHHKLKVNYLLSNVDRATEILNNVVPYTRYVMRSAAVGVPDGAFEEAFGALFSPEMLRASEGIHWDPRVDGVVTEFDEYFDTIVNAPDFFDFAGMEPPLARLRSDAEDLDPRQAHIRDLVQGRGNDSIAQNTVWTEGDDISAIAPDGPDDATAFTTASLQSIQMSLSTQLEQSLDQRMQQLQMAMMQQITTSISAALSRDPTHAPPNPRPPEVPEHSIAPSAPPDPDTTTMPMDTDPIPPTVDHPGALLQNPAGGDVSGQGT